MSETAITTLLNHLESQPSLPGGTIGLVREARESMKGGDSQRLPAAMTTEDRDQLMYLVGQHKRASVESGVMARASAIQDLVNCVEAVCDRDPLFTIEQERTFLEDRKAVNEQGQRILDACDNLSAKQPSESEVINAWYGRESEHAN